MFQEEVKGMNDESEDVYLKQLREKIEPKLPEILQEFREVLKKHGVLEFAVVSFNLDPDESVKRKKVADDDIQAAGACTYICGNNICYRQC